MQRTCIPRFSREWRRKKRNIKKNLDIKRCHRILHVRFLDSEFSPKRRFPERKPSRNEKHMEQFPNMRKRKASKIVQEKETNKADFLVKLIAAKRDSCFLLSFVLGIDNESESDTECHFRGFHWKFTVFIVREVTMALFARDFISCSWPRKIVAEII